MRWFRALLPRTTGLALVLMAVQVFAVSLATVRAGAAALAPAAETELVLCAEHAGMHAGQNLPAHHEGLKQCKCCGLCCLLSNGVQPAPDLTFAAVRYRVAPQPVSYVLPDQSASRAHWCKGAAAPRAPPLLLG
jgi:hypothetical protein